MKKFLFSITLTLILISTSCKGPGSGPLQREAFKKEDAGQNLEGEGHQGQVISEKINVTVEPCDGCISISNLLEDKKSFAGKVIKVKGQVTKYNPGILGKNWVHIQDGTEHIDGFDLTVTTDIQTSVGETVTFEGKIILNKDFGYGYFYYIIMEDGKPVL